MADDPSPLSVPHPPTQTPPGHTPGVTAPLSRMPHTQVQTAARLASGSAHRSPPPTTSRRKSLSARLFWLTIGIVLALEVLIFVPDIAHERRLWIEERLDDAHLAVLAAASAPGGAVDPATAAELLRLSGTEWARLDRPARAAVVLDSHIPIDPARVIDLRQEDYVMGVVRALRALTIDRDELVQVIGDSRASSRAGTVEFVVRSHDETLALRRFARAFVWLSLAIACLTGALVYVAVLMLLVRPMRRIIGSIAAFRADPERTVPLDPGQVSLLGDDEMALAGRELAAMQSELRGALWRNARLAALGTAVAKISHDLRGILSPALLAAERLSGHDDPSVRRSGEVLMRTVDRATDLVGRTLDFVREGPPLLALAPVDLARLVDESAEAARAPGRVFTLVNYVPAGLLIEADRNQFYRVVVNLLRNAAEAGARSVRVAAVRDGMAVQVDLADDGPGLPAAVRAVLFRPFAGSVQRGGTGLGLAIAHDLMLAHGGTIALVSTGAEGTVFRLTLPAARSRSGQAAPPMVVPSAPAAVGESVSRHSANAA